jgi:hypothetical protein
MLTYVMVICDQWSLDPLGFHFEPLKLQNFSLLRIRILLLNVVKICDHWSTGPLGLYVVLPGPHFERPWLNLQPLKLLNFDFNAWRLHYG